jgi:DNA repair exonuclease SbcCD nuclease subunit
MKILFSADWHIKLGQKNVPILWQAERYHTIVEQFNECDADLHIIGGDIFDRVPTLDELNLYFMLVAKFNKPTYIYPGNHEATGRSSTFLSQLIDVTQAVNSKVVIIDDWIREPGQFEILPYNRLKDFAKHPEKFEQKESVLFTHVRGEIPPHVTPEVPLELFDPWEHVFAGDLHSFTNSQRNIFYPGSPLTTSFHRNEVKTGFFLIDINEKVIEWKELEVPQLLRKTVDDPKLMVATDYHHTIYELQGDLVQLSKAVDSSLLDKKVVNVETGSTLLFTKDMSIEEELALFLKDIMKLKDNQVKELMGIYSDYIT